MTNANGKAVTRPRRYDYTTEEIDRALLQVAWNAGGYAAAHRALAAEGLHIPRTTLEKWAKQTHHARYIEIREEEIPAIHHRLSSELEDGARNALHTQAQAVELASNFLTEANTAKRAHDDTTMNQKLRQANDAATIARNTATVAGINTQNVRPMRDMPVRHITETRTVDQALADLARILGSVPGTAEEEPAPHLPPAA